MSSLSFLSEPFQVLFDLNQSPQFALQATSISDFHHGESAVITTNALSFEPGEFANGVVSFGDNNVFILHQAGASFGANQRILLITVSSGTATLTLTSLNVNSSQNTGSVSISVFASSNADLSDAEILATYPANNTDQTVTFSSPVIIPPASSKVFALRAVEAIPDNSNYVAHTNIFMAGTKVNSFFHDAIAVRLWIQTSDPHRVVNHLCLGPVSGHVDYTGSDPFWTIKSASDNSGYTLSSGPNYMSTRLDDLPNRGTPCIALTTDVTQALIVVPELDDSMQTFTLRQVGTNNALTLDTRGTLGTLEALQPGNSLPVFQHWTLSNNLQMYDGWTQFGSNIDALICAMGDQIYAVEHGTGNINQYDGTAWVKISDPVQSIDGNDDAIFVIPASKDKVLKMGPTDTVWVQVGGAIALSTLVAADSDLLGLDQAGKAYHFNGTAWVDLNSPALSVLVSSSSHYCALTADKTQVLLYNGSTWSQIGAAMTNLVAAGNALYGVDAQGNLQRFDGLGAGWTVVSTPAYFFTGKHGHTYKASPGVDGVFSFTNEPNEWKRIGGTVTSLAVGDTVLFGLRGNDAYLFQLGERKPHVQAMASMADTRFHTLSAAPNPSFTTNKWIFSFETLDETFAGYDGKVKCTVFGRSTITQHTFTLKTTHFVRGATYRWEFDLPKWLVNLGSISMGSEDNFWGDQWHLGTVTAFCENNFQLHTFDFNCQVPIRGTTNRTATSVQTVKASGAAAIVHIWAYRGLDVAVGHASMTLADGTYISWWPSGVLKKYMSLLDITYSAVAFNNRNLDGDIKDEEQKPDTNVSVWHLNVDAIKTWWQGFNTPGKLWIATTQNCSTTVYQAILAGGGLNHLNEDRQAFYGRVMPWTPNTVLQLAQEIAAANT